MDAVPPLAVRVLVVLGPIEDRPQLEEQATA